jgi:acyl carrier protein
MKSMGLLKAFVITELISDPSVTDIQECESLIESGIIDSLGIMKLLDYIEVTFSVKIADKEIVPENFENLEAICGLISAKSIGGQVK